MSEENNIGTEVEAVDKQIYEIGFHIVPSVPEEKLGAEFSLLKKIIEDNSGAVIHEEMPKLRTLAYEMRKETSGKYQKYNTAYFGSVKFEVVPEGALKINEAFIADPSILRYLLVKTVRENTMTTPRIPFYRKTEIPKMEDNKDQKAPEKTPVSEIELDKAIDAAIAE